MNSDSPVSDPLAVLKAQMRRQIAQTPMEPSRPLRTARLGWSAATVAAVVVAIATVVLATGILGSSRPAFAAVKKPNGAVIITLRDLRRIPDLNAKLAHLGTRIRVVPAKRGCVAPVRIIEKPGQAPTAPRTLKAPARMGIVSITVTSDVTSPDRTTVVAATPHGFLLSTSEVAGQAPKCVGYAPAGSNKPFLIQAHK